MTTKEYPTIGERVHTKRLDNGLNVYVYEKKGFNKAYALFATKYGGADRRFKLGDKWYDTPAGIAHFLEHKMFDMSDGSNALNTLYGKGASANAFTSSDMTAYLFECVDGFAENLDILLDFVSKPWFTEESVNKEQGIIGQEIRMGEDNPGVSLYYGLLRSLYAHNPARDPVAGTVESIAEISPETLYNCHRVFYNPSNMVLCVAGDVDPEAVCDAAWNILPKQPGEVPVRDYGPQEGRSPFESRCERNMEVSAPVFYGGTKCVLPEDGTLALRQDILGDLTMSLLMGRGSPMYSKLYGDGLIDYDFSAGYESVADIAYTIFGGESRDPDSVAAAVEQEIIRTKNLGFDPDAFERRKKAMYGMKLREFNSLDRICYGAARGHFGGYDPLQAFELLDSLTVDDAQEFVGSNLDPEGIALSIVRPVEQ